MANREVQHQNTACSHDADRLLVLAIQPTDSPSRSVLMGDDAPLHSSCPLSRLPKNAKNVTYSYGGVQTNTYYEFEIEEEQFVDWIATIERFKPWPTGQSLRRFNLNENSVTWTAVVDGFGYSWQDPHDADRAENFRYDRETGRCYYWYMPFYPD